MECLSGLFVVVVIQSSVFGFRFQCDTSDDLEYDGHGFERGLERDL